MATEFRRRIEDPHAWFIFADISLRSSGLLWDASDQSRRVFGWTPDVSLIFTSPHC